MNKEILRLAIPNIISNITIPLLGMVDLALLGHLESEKYIGAIALGGIIFSILYWPLSFLRMGTSGFTAQAYGEKNEQESSNILIRALVLAIGIGIVLIALQVPVSYLSLEMLNGSKEVKELALEYFQIRIFAAPATLAMYVFNGWLVGMQNSKYPMYIAISINVFNIVFNLLFVVALGMKVEGVAYGTLLAQFSGLILSLFLVRKKYWRIVRQACYSQIVKVAELKRFFHVNADMFIRTLCVVAVLSFFTNQSASQDDMMLAANTLLLQFFYLFSFFADGFAYATEALVGKYVGAKSIDKIRTTVRFSFKWGIGIAILVSGIYWIADKHILLLLTNNTSVQAAAQEYLFWIWLIPLTSFASFIWDGVYIGATASKAMRNTMLVSSILVFFPCYFILQNILHNHALWFALQLFLLSRGVLQFVLVEKSVYRQFTQVSST